jgi:cytochrome d ubiquinol oxidase subunit II
VRGVPLDGSGYFFEPLWTNFRLDEETGILDWYTILVGMLALAALVMHGGLWVQWKTEGAVNKRSGHAAGFAWWAVVALTGVVTALTFHIQPQVTTNFKRWPWAYTLPLLAVAGIVGVRWNLIRGDERMAFFSSCLYLTGMLTSAVFGVYPLVLPARNPMYSLTVESTKAGAYGLQVGLAWWVIGIILAATYFTVVYRMFRGKVKVRKELHGYGGE